MNSKVRIAHLAGPTATIQNTPPLVTSNKAREKLGLPLLSDTAGAPHRFDALRAQRLAAPATVYVEQFSAHPLESDAAELYGPPDGYIDAEGRFNKQRTSDEDKPVYEVRIGPEDGLYPLPYMAVQSDGSPWEEECASPGAPAAKARQGFFPDGSRSFEEIDRLSVGDRGVAASISALADVDFYRITPPGGYTKGLLAEKRTDKGAGDIPPETQGRDFFPYKPYHLAAAPVRPSLARTTNMVQEIMASGDYDGAVWTQGSPQVEETAYWMNLLIDTTLPICGNAAQRPHGQISNDGPKNIVDSVQFIASRVWADAEGRNRVGVVVIQEQQVFAAREVMKVDARPGGYVATGGGGILGAVTHQNKPIVQYVPATRHTWMSDVNISRLPDTVQAVRATDGISEFFDLPIKDADGNLVENAIPSVSISKDGSYASEDFFADPADESDLVAAIDRKLRLGRLGGFVIEGLTPYGSMTSTSRQALLLGAVFRGLPVVRVGRGSPEGFADPHPHFIAGSNLTSTKARMLLMAALMKLGSLPIAGDPMQPTREERAATEKAVAAYQAIFDTH
ncbi:Asparaginase [Faunimonas pinastri]|uniref:Asparaginase n=1 Tax=Faunimonas pinastri TaxID=1855383 RepID=A0A1H9E5V6_9HYPH|nr:asparaginase domain-containing protein [Faunimonas pinastri]SEQ21126.1 Asparaginase [Faunimonas pinastri]